MDFTDTAPAPVVGLISEEAGAAGADRHNAGLRAGTGAVPWTASELAFAISQWEKGVSATAIGIAMGRSRNSIISRMHRSNAKTTTKSRLPAVWTNHKVRELISLRLTGKSVDDIAAHFGATHDAIYRRLSRIRQAQPELRASLDLYVLSRKPRHKSEYVPRKRRPVMAAEESLALDSLIPESQRKQFLDLKQGDCRWPVGDVGSPDFFFCGAVAERGQPYCERHCAVAFNNKPVRTISAQHKAALDLGRLKAGYKWLPRARVIAGL